MKKLILALLASLIPSTAFAGTFVVDIQLRPGSHFQQVQAAMDSGHVMDGDTLLIRPGSYLPFVTGKGLTLRGLGANPGDVNFFGSTGVYSWFLNCVSPVNCSNVEFRGLIVRDSPTSVRLFNTKLASLTAQNVSSIRVENELLDPTSGFSLNLTKNSNGEFLRCNFFGDSTPGGFQVGIVGAAVTEGSYGRFAECNIMGGTGQIAWPPPTLAGDGAYGLRVDLGSTVQFIGRVGNFIHGGMGGNGVGEESGKGAAAVFVGSDCNVRLSNCDLAGGTDGAGMNQVPSLAGDPSSVSFPSLADPLLTHSGSFAPGVISNFSVQAGPGDLVMVFYGKQITALPLPGIVGHLATQYSGPFKMGTADASGQFDMTLKVPVGIALDTIVSMQARAIYLADGSARLTNPTTIWVQ